MYSKSPKLWFWFEEDRMTLQAKTSLSWIRRTQLTSDDIVCKKRPWIKFVLGPTEID